MPRYTPDELDWWGFLPAVASKSAPTAANVTAGTEFTTVVSSISGFMLKGNNVDAPDLGTRFTRKVPGRLSSDDSTIEFYKGDDEDDLEEDIRALFPRGTRGFIARVHPKEGAKGPRTAGSKIEIWPVEVMSNSVNNPAPGEVQKFTVEFSINDQPVQNATIAA